ncbi:hypothetical protein Dimus_033387, partial [Dionaea muscipula]
VFVLRFLPPTPAQAPHQRVVDLQHHSLRRTPRGSGPTVHRRGHPLGADFSKSGKKLRFAFRRRPSRLEPAMVRLLPSSSFNGEQPSSATRRCPCSAVLADEPKRLNRVDAYTLSFFDVKGKVLHRPVAEGSLILLSMSMHLTGSRTIASVSIMTAGWGYQQEDKTMVLLILISLSPSEQSDGGHPTPGYSAVSRTS